MTRSRAGEICSYCKGSWNDMGCEDQEVACSSCLDMGCWRRCLRYMQNAL